MYLGLHVVVEMKAAGDEQATKMKLRFESFGLHVGLRLTDSLGLRPPVMTWR